MNHLLLLGGIVWTIILSVWAYRLSAHDIYAEKVWVWLWIAGRLLLRFILGLALLWAFVASLRPPEAAYRILIVEADLPEAWEKADTLLRQRYSGIKTGLLALKGSQAFWILPPTHDPALFRWIREVRPQYSMPPQTPPSSASPRYLTPLSPYLPFTQQIVWMGRRFPPNPPEIMNLLWCEKSSPPAQFQSVFFSAAAIPPPHKAFSEVEKALFLAGGCVLLLLLGDGLMRYILRQNLPLK